MTTLYNLLFSLVIIVSLAGIPMAAKVPTPTEPPEGVKLISIDEANQLLHQKNMYIYDMRKELYYGKGHIPGAVSLPYKWTKKESNYNYESKFDITKLPTDKNAPIIIHCDGPDEWKSYYTSKAAKEAGYNNIMWLRDGYSTWTTKGYAVEH
ncbi:MAG: rhodanese-like domain-containing protein [Nitrospiraceae bacterium]|nr:MAG: rhodanese-like domain-containing protein [Nitrospiraceae bacterium]